VTQNVKGKRGWSITPQSKELSLLGQLYIPPFLVGSCFFSTDSCDNLKLLEMGHLIADDALIIFRSVSQCGQEMDLRLVLH